MHLEAVNLDYWLEVKLHTEQHIRIAAMPGVPMMASQGSSLGDPKRVLSLMTKPLSIDLRERHLVSIKHLCKEASNGCTLQSLPELTQILDIVLRSTKARPDGQLIDAACDLLR